MNKITNKEICIFLFILINSFFMFIGINRINNFIVIILSILIGYFFINYYIHLLNKKKIKNNKLILLTCIPILSIMIIYLIDKTNSFISYNILQNVSIPIITISFLILIFYILKKDIDVIIKVCELFIYLFIFIFILEIITIIKYIDISNLVIQDMNLIGLIKDISIYIIVTISPCFYLFFIDNKFKQKPIKKTYIISNIFIFINLLICILILGNDLINIYTYPEMAILKKVSFLSIIDRMESLFSINFLFSGIIFLAINFYTLNICIIRLFNIKKKELLYIITIILIFILENFITINFTIYLTCLILLMIIPIINSKVKN